MTLTPEMLVQLPPATTMAVQNMDENPREQPKRPTKKTLNTSSDIFAWCSKLQTQGTSSEVFLCLNYLYAWDVDDQPRTRLGGTNVLVSSRSTLTQLGHFHKGTEILLSPR